MGETRREKVFADLRPVLLRGSSSRNRPVLPLVSPGARPYAASDRRDKSRRSAHMSNIDTLFTRNAAFAASDVRYNPPRLPFLPHKGLYVITCIDPRVDPTEFLGLEFGEAIVARTVGGRATPAIIQDVAYIGYRVETKASDGPYFEAAIIHHTDCGSGLLADEEFRHGFSQRTGYDEQVLVELPVLDPPVTVR